MKLKNIKGLLPEPLKNYTTDHNSTNGLYSRTKNGKRWYNIDFNQGYNTAIYELSERELFDYIELNEGTLRGVLEVDFQLTKHQATVVIKSIAAKLPEIIRGKK